MKKINNYKEALAYFDLTKMTVSTHSDNARYIFINGKRWNLPLYVE